MSDELNEQEQQQVDLSFEFAVNIVMPMLTNYEDTIELLVADGEFIGSPHYDVMALCVRELVERGWTADEIVEQVRHHAECQEDMRSKRVVN